MSTLVQSGYAPIEHGVEQGFFMGEVVEKTAFAYSCLCGDSIQCKMSRSELDDYILSRIDYYFSRIL